MIIHSCNDSVIPSADSLRNWGIPLYEAHESAEVVLLQRLVWVRYKSHWWPALLYHSYAELQQQVTDQMDTALKAQFAMAIMRQMQNKRSIKVARLLGKSSLEVVEVKVGSYHEFYSMLPKILPKAINIRLYGNDIQLFLDLHRALDQVEAIISEVSEEQFAIMPNTEICNWLIRGREQVSQGEDELDPGTCTYFPELKDGARGGISTSPLPTGYKAPPEPIYDTLAPQNSMTSMGVLPPERSATGKALRSRHTPGKIRKKIGANEITSNGGNVFRVTGNDRRDDTSGELAHTENAMMVHDTPERPAVKAQDVVSMFEMFHKTRKKDAEQHDKFFRPPSCPRNKPEPERTYSEHNGKKQSREKSHRRSQTLSSDSNSLTSSQFDSRLNETERMLQQMLNHKKQQRRLLREKDRGYTTHIPMDPSADSLRIDPSADLVEFNTTLQRLDTWFLGDASNEDPSIQKPREPIEILPGFEGDDIVAVLSTEIEQFVAENKTFSRADIMQLLQEAEDDSATTDLSDQSSVTTLSVDDMTTPQTSFSFWQRMACQ